MRCREVAVEGERNADSPCLSGIILLKIIEYLQYKVQYAEFVSSDIREDFLDRIDPYIALEL